MSLFGGDDSVSQRSLSPEDDFPGSIASSASATPTLPYNDLLEEEQDAQRATYDALDADDEDDDAFEEETEEELDMDDRESRLNRFIGKTSTWRGYTAAERHLAASLDQTQAGDLAAHLYNAHALKRRVWLPPEELKHIKDWQSRDLWLKRGDDLKSTDSTGEFQTELIPVKRWTAWPLLPTDVPGPYERFGRRRTDEGENGSMIDASRGQPAGCELREEMLAVFLRLAKEKWTARTIAEEPLDEKPNRAGTASRSRSRSQSVKSAPPSAPRTPHDDLDVEMGEADSLKKNDDPTSASEAETKSAHVIDLNKRSRNPWTKYPEAKPTFLADDDSARRILQPSINSLLIQLDGLASGIRRTRMNHFGRAAPSGTSGSETTLDVDPVKSSTKKPTSRASTRAPSVARGNASEASSTQDDRGASEEVGLMDWSEVLGVASMIGWNEKVVARTAQRCAALFGEGMAFRHFGENAAHESVPELIQYTPMTIPGPDIIGAHGIVASNRPLFEVGTLRCPHTDCRYHYEDKATAYKVVDHVRKVHGYDPRTNDSDNEERKHGGVHKDGFLRPITSKHGWLGARRSKSREAKQSRKEKGKVESTSSDDDSS